MELQRIHLMDEKTQPIVAELVSLAEIAERLNYAPSTVKAWRRRDRRLFCCDFPPPLRLGALGEFRFEWRVVEAWYEHTHARRRPHSNRGYRTRPER